MRKIIVVEFVTIDGVIQAPGGPQEDSDGNFKHGGWVVPYSDEWLGAIMHEQMTRTRALLLGRKTYEIFASYWPTHESGWPGINSATKYVVSDTRTDPLWDNTVFINDNVVQEIRGLKQQDGPDLQVYGSSGSSRRFSSTIWWTSCGSRFFLLPSARASSFRRRYHPGGIQAHAHGANAAWCHRRQL